MGTRDSGLRWRVPVVFAVFIAILSALLTKRWIDAGNFPARVPWLTVALLVAISGLVLWFGSAVRAYQRGLKAELSPIRAARTLALAQAAALTGAALVGFYAGQVVALLPDRDLNAVSGLLWRFAIGIGAGLLVLGCGMLAQSWCRIPPPTDEPPREG
ncbi:MAG: DUF3180 domain-containing protein [Tetrasphaera sp.]